MDEKPNRVIRTLVKIVVRRTEYRYAAVCTSVDEGEGEITSYLPQSLRRYMHCTNVFYIYNLEGFDNFKHI